MAVSFRESIDWVARNSKVDDILKDTPEQIAGYTTVQLMAHQFERSTLEIAVAVIKYRREKLRGLSEGDAALFGTPGAEIGENPDAEDEESEEEEDEGDKTSMEKAA